MLPWRYSKQNISEKPTGKANNISDQKLQTKHIDLIAMKSKIKAFNLSSLSYLSVSPSDPFD